jgi:tetratricopeptide (TPR) repeat protein
MTDARTARRGRGAAVAAALLLVILVTAALVWFASPAGLARRLARMSDADLVAYTARIPGDVPALLELARRMERQGMDGEALADYRKAADADPKRGDAWAGVARLAVKQRDPDAAREAATKVMRVSPADPKALRDAGEALLAVGDVNGARDALVNATAAAPGDAAAWDALARVQTERGSYSDALRAGEQAIRLAPDVASYHLHLATARRLSADAAGADRALAEASRLAPDDGDVLLEQGVLRAGTARTAEEKLQAEATLVKARVRLRGTPREAEALRRLGQWYLAAGKLPEAQTTLEACLRLAPGDSAALFALSRTLALRGRSAEADALMKRYAEQADLYLAVRQLRMRMQREPDRADLPRRLGDLLAAHGQAEAARTAYQRSLEIDPNQPDLRRHVESLR